MNLEHGTLNMRVHDEAGLIFQLGGTLSGGLGLFPQRQVLKETPAQLLVDCNI